MPTIFIIQGYRFFFFSNEGTEPIHVHVEKGEKVKVTDRELIVYLLDGRKLAVPLVWFPKLLKASVRQRNKYYLIGEGVGIHWPELDEDLSINGLLTAN